MKNTPRFSVFEADVYGIRMVLDNIRLFVLTALAKMAFFSVYLLIASLTGLLFLKPWNLVQQLKPLLTCSTREVCLDVWKNQVWPAISSSVGSYVVAFIIFFILAVLLGFGIYLGFIRIVLTLHDTGRSFVRLLFSCFGLVPKFVIAAFLYFIIVSIGLSLFVIPGIYFSLRLLFFSYFIVDKNAGIIESLRKSWNVTNGQVWQLFGIILLFPVIALMPLGIFFITPFATVVLTYVYRKLVA